MADAQKPCRSPYCECAEGQCTHPGCYDARGEQPEAVAVIGDTFSLLWASGDAISDIAKRHGLKVGSKLYAAPQPPAQAEPCDMGPICIGCEPRGPRGECPGAPAAPQAGEAEPLFLLHTGQIDGGGEQDEWETEANSWTAVEEFCRQHPGKTIGLYPASQPMSREGMRLSDPEMKPVMDELKRRVLDEPGFALSLLQRAGIANPDGSLSEDFGGIGSGSGSGEGAA